MIPLNIPRSNVDRMQRVFCLCGHDLYQHTGDIAAHDSIGHPCCRCRCKRWRWDASRGDGAAVDTRKVKPQ